jgi:predicted ribosomally synthesized peptide with SipW-like signal peptide
MNKSVSRKTLLASVAALSLSALLFAGTTYAWFTDSASSGISTIQSGNLDVNLYQYKEVETANEDGTTTKEDKYVAVDGNTTVFDNNTAWEPGAVEVVYLKVANEGSLSLKYSLNIPVLEKNVGTSVNNDDIDLSKILQAAVVDIDAGATYNSRSEAIAAAKTGKAITLGDDDVVTGTLDPESSKTIAVVVYMPETVSNEANHNGQNIPYIKLGVTVNAGQTPKEKDSYDENYDTDALKAGEYIDNRNSTYTDASGNLNVKVGDNYVVVEPEAEDKVEGLYKDAEGNDYAATEAALKYTFANEETSITLLDDMEITYGGTYGNGTYDTYVLAENADIDLNGNALTVNSNDMFMLAGSGSSIKNGTIKAGPNSSFASGKITYTLGVTAGSKNVTLENLDIEGGLEVLGPSTVTLKNVNITATNYYDIYAAGGATATIESGTYTAAAGMTHFYIEDSSSSIIVNGGTFSGGTPTLQASSQGKLVNNLQ